MPNVNVEIRRNLERLEKVVAPLGNQVWLDEKGEPLIFFSH